MNRSLANVLFGGIGTSTTTETHKIEGSITQTTVEDTVDALANADSVILVLIFLCLSFCLVFTFYRWLATVWQSRKLSMPYQKLQQCFAKAESMSG